MYGASADVRLKETDLAAEFPYRHRKTRQRVAERSFKPTLESNGKLYGLGSNDAGASVVSLLQVFLTLCRTTQAYNLIYLASCEEEVSGKGGIECVLPELPPIQFAIVGEPTEMQPAIAEKD